MRAKPLPIKDVCELVAHNLVQGGFNPSEARSIQMAESLNELRGRLESFGFDTDEADEYIIGAVVDDTRCFVCHRAESEHVDSDYNAEGMCTRTDQSGLRNARSG